MNKNDNDIGRPRKFDKPEDLQRAIDVYFEKCDNNTKQIVTKDGVVLDVLDPIPYTIEGLCMVLEIDRASLLHYEKYPEYKEFFNTVKKAKSKVQLNKLERGLSGRSNPAVTIFDLKNNHGYVDRQETTQTNINISIDPDDAEV